MKIAIIGAGAWGTALSIALTRKEKHSVSLWAFEKEVVASIRSVRINQAFLPGHELQAELVRSVQGAASAAQPLRHWRPDSADLGSVELGDRRGSTGWWLL